MKAADKLIAIALAVGSLLFLGWLVLRFFLPATLPFWLGLAIAALLRPVSLLFSQKLRCGFHHIGKTFRGNCRSFYNRTAELFRKQFCIDFSPLFSVQITFI